jgi:hypothetical protein
MSRSHRTQKRSVIAKRRLSSCKKSPLPRIIERKPFHGDSHPISKSTIRKSLKYLPIEYLYGLKRIELLPRSGNAIGYPFGCYLVDEKAIWLYSLPMTWTWNESQVSKGYITNLYIWGARDSYNNDQITIHWSKKTNREQWFFFDVFMHELGHHYRNQYKTRDKVASYKLEELFADIHANRLYRKMPRQIKNYGFETPEKP